MKMIFLIIFALIHFNITSIIPISFDYFDGKTTIKIHQSKNNINCTISTFIPKSYIPKYLNAYSQTKKNLKYKDHSLSLINILKGKKHDNLYEDFFVINQAEIKMKYYVDPEMDKCIISFSNKQSADESLINNLYNTKKIDNNAFGIKFNEKLENLEILYLGGLPEEEKKGLFSFSYQYSLYERFISGVNWYLPVEEGSIKTKEKVISMSLSCPGYIELEKEDIFVPTSFYELIYNNFLGFFIIGKNCVFENNDFICNCEELNKINSFETIYLNIGGIRIEFNIRELFSKKKDKCYFIVKHNEKEYFILGKKFLKNYKIEFVRNKQINIYSKNKFNIVEISLFKRILNIIKIPINIVIWIIKIILAIHGFLLEVFLFITIGFSIIVIIVLSIYYCCNKVSKKLKLN